MIGKFLTAAAATAMVAAPVMAAPANSAASLSVAKSARATTATEKSNKLNGEAILPIAIGAGILAIGVVAIVNDDDDDETPVSN
ncbi:hypothetical protein [Pacificimonas flava]|uniref:Uncharacterized protein n=1 Tax=Pacificimonas flava TaxID=1234595 RepID=M2U774_9SPHN|nr:hypothetical protein [Pacificimonas flava]EMD83833.1 hypothetical protein C725_0805 [Pacificimonas flava]MBB5281189.1 hypothetical protein [Pacificimonas flava]